MYWIKLAGATDAADTTGQVSIEIPILGIEWSTELIGDTVTYADGTVKEPVQQRITYVIKAFPFTTNDYTAEFTIEDIRLPGLWPRVCAIDTDVGVFSALWAAIDRKTDKTNP